MCAATMNLVLKNPSTSGVSANKIYVSILGTDPTNNQFGHLDFSTGQMVTSSTFKYISGVTSKTLDKIQAIGSIIPVPAIQSARIYFAIGEDFDPSMMPVSGPSPSLGNKTLFDKIEFDTHTPGFYNINGTSVDFYGISYEITAIPSGKSSVETVGFGKTRTEIINALYDIPLSPAGQQSGNTTIFQQCALQNGKGIMRVLSPKTMALTDWGSTQGAYVANANLCSHFLDEYIKKHCWKPNRRFSFYTKDWPGSKNQIYGRVSSDGLTLNLYTDAGMTLAYTVPSLPRPNAAWPLPDFNTATNYHNTISTNVDGIDWGFLLIGNVIGTGPGAHWATDPAAMAIMVSIDRGVMHLDNGTVDWVNPINYYRGNGSNVSTVDMPILYYSSILHEKGLNGLAYVLSYDDVYGQNPSITFDAGAQVTVSLVSLESVPVPATQTLRAGNI